MKNCSMCVVASVLTLAAGSAILLGGMAAASNGPDSPNAVALAQSPSKSDAPAATSGAGFKVDPVHSSVVYSIRHKNAANFYGIFREVSGRFSVTGDASDFIDVSVKADSIDSNNAGRDKHLKGQDFFSVKEFPTLTFKSTSVKKAGDKTFDVTGDLTVRGQTKSVVVKVENTAAAGQPLGGIEARFTISRKEFGITYGPEALGDSVSVIVALEGSK